MMSKSLYASRASQTGMSTATAFWMMSCSLLPAGTVLTAEVGREREGGRECGGELVRGG